MDWTAIDQRNNGLLSIAKTNFIWLVFYFIDLVETDYSTGLYSFTTVKIIDGCNFSQTSLVIYTKFGEDLHV